MPPLAANEIDGPPDLNRINPSIIGLMLPEWMSEPCIWLFGDFMSSLQDFQTMMPRGP